MYIVSKIKGSTSAEIYRTGGNTETSNGTFQGSQAVNI